MVVLLFKEAILTYGGPKTLSLVVIHGRVDFFPPVRGKTDFPCLLVIPCCHSLLSYSRPPFSFCLVSFCFKSGSASVSEDEKKKKYILSRVMLVKRLRGNLCSSFTGRKGGIWGEGGGLIVCC